MSDVGARRLAATGSGLGRRSGCNLRASISSTLHHSATLSIYTPPSPLLVCGRAPPPAHQVSPLAFVSLCPNCGRVTRSSCRLAQLVPARRGRCGEPRRSIKLQRLASSNASRLACPLPLYPLVSHIPDTRGACELQGEPCHDQVCRTILPAKSARMPSGARPSASFQ